MQASQLEQRVLNKSRLTSLATQHCQLAHAQVCHRPVLATWAPPVTWHRRWTPPPSMTTARRPEGLGPPPLSLRRASRVAGPNDLIERRIGGREALWDGRYESSGLRTGLLGVGDFGWVWGKRVRSRSCAPYPQTQRAATSQSSRRCCTIDILYDRCLATDAPLPALRIVATDLPSTGHESRRATLDRLSGSRTQVAIFLYQRALLWILRIPYARQA